MFARRVSVMFSILALGLMVLTCSLGYRDRSADRQPEAVQVMAHSALAADAPELRRCNALDRQLSTCATALRRLDNPPVPSHYPEKIRRLMIIKKRYQLEKEATRACHCFPDAPLAPESYEAYLYRSDCDDAALSLAENQDDL